jgi:hypothetical protein
MLCRLMTSITSQIERTTEITVKSKTESLHGELLTKANHSLSIQIPTNLSFFYIPRKSFPAAEKPCQGEIFCSTIWHKFPLSQKILYFNRQRKTFD